MAQWGEFGALRVNPLAETNGGNRRGWQERPPVLGAKLLGTDDGSKLLGQMIRLRRGVWDAYLRGNPAEFNLKVRATQSSSSALQLGVVNNRALYDLIDEMIDKDNTISAILPLFVAMVLNFPEEIVRMNDDPIAEEIAAAASELLKSSGQLSESDAGEGTAEFGWSALRWSLVFGSIAHGFSVNEIIWEERNGRIAPAAYLHRHPGFFIFDELGRMYVHTTGIEKTLVAPFKFCLMRQPALYGNPYGQSALYWLRFLYHFKKEAIKAWIDFIDTYGVPLAVGRFKTLPLDGSEAPSLTAPEAARDNLKQILSNLRRDTGVVLSDYEDLEFRDRGGARLSPHKDFVEWADKQIVRSLMGGLLQVMEAEFGTRAQASEHAATGRNKLTPMTTLLEQAINRWIIRPFIALNWGEDRADSVRYRIDTDDETAVETSIALFKAAKVIGVETSRKQFFDWTGLHAPSDPDDAIAPGALADGGEPFSTFAERGDKKKIQRTIKALETMADEPKADALRRARAAVLSAVSRLRSLDGSARLEGGMLGALELARDVMANPTARSAFAASHLRALADGYSALRRVLPAADRTSIEPAGELKEAVEWMLDRRLAARADVELIAEALGTLAPEVSSARIMAAVRDEVLALAGSPTAELTGKFRQAVAAAVENGDTIATFLAAVDESVAAGALPGGMDAYLENVYRTETALAYSRQQRENMQAREVKDHLWGFEFMNPNDDRSRESHAAMDGVRVRLGGEAEEASWPGPPWSFQCRCVRVPLIEADPDKSQLEETDGALALVESIERFEG
jgi:hypothetical protein